MNAERSTPFGAMLKRHRLAAGLSQEELASRAGLSPHGISDLERGARRVPRPSTLRMLADALGLSDAERSAFLGTASAARTSQTPPTADARDELPATQVGQAADAEPPPAVSRPAHNLPIQPTPLIGREREVERLMTLLNREDVRLVTITGPGGVGKTRLALAVATSLAQGGAFPDGVWLVRLSRLSDAAVVLPSIAQSLALREYTSTEESLADLLCAHLRERRLLLLLDNFEHVLPAATDIATLLAACPGLKVLVTSRTGLRLRSEHEFAISPLALPPDAGDQVHAFSPEQLRQFAATALFIERAQSVRADMQITPTNAPAIAAICCRLDGLPLAIELAATQVRVLSPPALLAHLERCLPLLRWGPRDLEERQQTMERTIAWSYDLLAPEERRLFRRLAVFVGGWTLDAAAAICTELPGAMPLGADMLGALGTLVEHSLVQSRDVAEETGDEPRFSMLHVIREYALAQLEASGEAGAMRDAHAAFYAERAKQAGEAALAVSSHTEGSWSRWLAQERDNLLSALAWASAHGRTNEALWIATALAHDDIARGSYTTARRRLDQLLATASHDDAVDPQARLLAISRARRFAAVQHDLARAMELGLEQLTVARTMGTPRYVADALAGLALLAMDRGALDEAARYAEESLVIARQAGDPATIAFALENLAIAQFARGRITQTRTLAEEGLALSRQAGFLWGQGINAGTLALVCCHEGNPMGALRVMREGHAALRDHGGLHVVTGTLLIAAAAWAAAGEGWRSARLFGAAEAAMARAEGGVVLALLRITQELAAPARTALGAERWERAFAEGKQLSLEHALAEALEEDRGGDGQEMRLPRARGGR